MEVTNAAAHRELGEAYLQLRRFKEAVEQFQDCIRLSPPAPAGHHSLGMAYCELGEFVHRNEHKPARIPQQLCRDLRLRSALPIPRRCFNPPSSCSAIWTSMPPPTRSRQRSMPSTHPARLSPAMLAEPQAPRSLPMLCLPRWLNLAAHSNQGKGERLEFYFAAVSTGFTELNGTSIVPTLCVAWS